MCDGRLRRQLNDVQTVFVDILHQLVTPAHAAVARRRSKKRIGVS
jgi:hypothetical protein